MLGTAAWESVRARASLDSPGPTSRTPGVRLLARLRDFAVDLRIRADIVEWTGEDGHHGRADFGAVGGRPTEIAPLSRCDRSDQEPDQK